MIHATIRTRKPSWHARALLLALILPLVGACGGAPPPTAEQLRLAIEQHVPDARFRRDTRVRLGRFALALGRGVLRMVDDADVDDAGKALSHVKRVEVATYEVLSFPDLAGFETPPAVESRLNASGWTPLVRERSADSQTWIYLREADDGTIRNLYIVDLDEIEMTVVDLSGRLDRVVAELVADDPAGFIAGL